MGNIVQGEDMHPQMLIMRSIFRNPGMMDVLMMASAMQLAKSQGCLAERGGNRGEAKGTRTRAEHLGTRVDGERRREGEDRTEAGLGVNGKDKLRRLMVRCSEVEGSEMQRGASADTREGMHTGVVARLGRRGKEGLLNDFEGRRAQSMRGHAGHAGRPKPTGRVECGPRY